MQTGPVELSLLAGVDWRTIEGIYGARTTGNLGAIDLYHPVAGLVPPVASTGVTRLSSDARNTGVFLQDRMVLGDFGLLLGLRHDRFKDAYTNPVTDISKTQPSAAISWEPRPGSMFYASHARSFQANTGTLLWGDRAAPPSEGKQLEVGWKQEWLDQRLMTTVSAFDLELPQAPARDAATCKPEPPSSHALVDHNPDDGDHGDPSGSHGICAHGHCHHTSTARAHGVDAIAPAFGELLLQSGRHDDVLASVTPDGLKRPPRV